jgi:hypothetical protein
MTDIRLPGADRGSGKVPPIEFPDPSVIPMPATRVNHKLEEWRKQIESRDALIMAASKDGYDHGYRAGYMDGAGWGGIVGAVAGAVAVALVWLSWAPVQRVLAAWGWA